MVNDNDIQLWAYLLSPTFQSVNTAGKPLTEGYIEVYIAGTRDKYYCASDFDGTLHPFQIPLDSLGSNIVLADPKQAYDVYIYNKFGSLQMSRYNVSPGNTGSGSGAANITVTSQDNSVDVTHTGNNYDLSIQDTINRIDNLEAQYGNISASTDYAVSYGYGDSGEFVLTDKASTGINYLNDMSGWRLKPGHAYQLNYNAKFTCDEQTNKLVVGKFYLDGDMSFSQDWNFNLDDSYDYTESFNGSTLIVVPSTLQYYDLKLKYTFNSIVNCQVDLENISIVDITSTVNMSSGGGAVYHEGDGIDITNNFISVDMDYINQNINIDSQLNSAINIANEYTDNSINEVISLVSGVTGLSGDYATHTEVYEATVTAINAATSDYPDVSDMATQTWVNNQGFLKEIPDNYATETEVYNATVTAINAATSNIPPQVQSDWEQTASGEPDYIKNKPEVEEVEFTELIPGNNITITASGSSSVISSNIDLSSYATHNEVYSATSTAINSANSYTDTAIANIDLTPAVEIVSPLNTISVSSTVDQVHNTKTFYIDTNEPDTNYWIGEARVQLSDTSSQGTVGYYKDVFDYAERSKGNLDATKLKKGLYLLTGCIMGGVTDIVDERIDYQICSYSTSAICGANLVYQHDASLENGFGEDSNQSHSFATLVDVKYDDTPMSLIARMNEPTTITTTLNLYFSDLCLYELKGASIGGGGSSPAASGSYEDGWGIIINGNVISVNPSIIPDTSNFATHNEVITYASSAITVANDYTDNAINNLNINQYATDVEVYNAIVTGIQAATGNIQQVQSDWTEVNTSAPSYIQHKPTEVEVEFNDLIAGQGITITASGSSSIISCTVTGGSGSSTTYTEGTGIDINNDVISVDTSVVALKSDINDMATKTWVGSQGYLTSIPSYYATDSEVYNATVTAIQTATANVQAQVQSNWTETASASPAYIQNKPTEVSVDFCPIIAGNNITITASGDSAVISSTASVGGSGTSYSEGFGIDINNNTISVDTSIVALASSIPDTSDMATKTWVGNQGYLTSVPSQYITETELSSELTDYALKTDIPDPVSGASGVKVEDSVVSLDNPVGLCAGENITITVSGSSAIISGQAGGSSYTEGTGIDITNNVISVDTSTIATQTWVGNQGYLTSIPSTYATDSEVQSAIQSATANLPQSDWTESSTSSLAYIQHKPEIEEVTFCPILAGSGVTISASGDSAVINASVDTSTLATKSEVNAVEAHVQIVSAAIPDTSDMATKTWVGNQGYLTSIPSSYATDTEVSAAIATATTDMATKTWVGNQGYLTSIPASYATDVEVTQAVTGATQNMVSYSGNTAINHIQLVSTLPGSPDANTLYLIAE